jgi:hypothetical protein
MPTSSHWDVIFNAGSPQTVLGIDFSGRRRREASFTELASRIGSGYRFLQARPVTVHPGRRPSSDEYIVSWVEGARQDGNPMRAVLGRCVGGIYAAVVAECISQWQPEPDIILVDPQFASTEFLGHELHKEISTTSSLMSNDEIELARKIACEISDLKSRDMVQIATYAVESYLEVITPAFERAGLGDARGSKLNEYFVSYMAWLSVAGELNPGRALKKSIVITSRDYAELPGRMLFDDAGSLAGRWIVCDVSHADLLRSDSVAKEVLGRLESRWSCSAVARKL